MSNLRFEAIKASLNRPKIEAIETDNPLLITIDSPTQRVSSDLTGDLPPVEHLIPMLSLDNSYNAEDLKDFDERIKNYLGWEKDIEIEYVSPLAKAQKGTELSSITRAIEILGSLANVAPVFDYINFDALVKHIADLVGVPQKVLKLQSQVNAEREQQAQLAEQQRIALAEAMSGAHEAGDGVRRAGGAAALTMLT